MSDTAQRFGFFRRNADWFGIASVALGFAAPTLFVLSMMNQSVVLGVGSVLACVAGCGISIAVYSVAPEERGLAVGSIALNSVSATLALSALILLLMVE